jgi:PAS domain S-box-containing protein
MPLADVFRFCRNDDGASDMASEFEAESPDALLHAFVEQHHAHAIILLDAEGRVVDWLGGAQPIFGWSKDEMHGDTLDRLFTTEDLERGVPADEIAIATASGRSPDDRWMKREDGSRFWAEGVLSALHDPNGTLIGFAKVLRNRTDSRGETVLLDNRIRTLEDDDAKRRAFFAMLVHELRGHLSALANATTVVERMTRSDAQVQAPTVLMARQIAILDRIVGDLAEMVRLRTGKLELAREVVDLNEAVRDAVASCEEQGRGRRQHIESLLAHAPTRVLADPARIQQILMNLITNASKYTPECGHIWVQTSVEGDEAVIRVRDDGIGIRPDMQARIFDLFTQDADAKEMSQGGLGLGLPLVRELVQMHGGSVQVHSEGEGQGAEFVVKLPLHTD